ncbi:MAG: DUF932 domain-containing protein [Brasilonema sp.]
MMLANQLVFVQSPIILESSKNSFANLGLLIDELAQVEISNQDAKDFLIETLGSKGEQNEIKSFYEQNKLVREAYYAYANHNSVGAHLETSQGNAWELLNCVTEQINHNSRSVGETHVNSLWHGHKAQLQTKVLSAMEHEFLKRQNKQAQTVGVRAY